MATSFDVIALHSINNKYYEANVAPLLSQVRTSQEQLEQRMQEALAGLEGKLDLLRQVPQMQAEIEELKVQLAAKAATSDVPTLRQHEELRTSLEEKAPASTLDDIVAEVDRKIEDMDSLCAKIERKVGDSALEQLQQKVNDCERRLVAADKANKAAFSQMRDSLENKANASDVPSYRELHEIADKKVRTILEKQSSTAAEKAASVEELVQKVLAEQRPVDTDVNSLKAQVETLQTQVAKKATAADVFSPSQQKSYAMSVERKLSFLANKVNQAVNKVTQAQQQAAQFAGGQGQQGVWNAQSQEWGCPPMMYWVPAEQMPKEWLAAFNANNGVVGQDGSPEGTEAQEVAAEEGASEAIAVSEAERPNDTASNEETSVGPTDRTSEAGFDTTSNTDSTPDNKAEDAFPALGETVPKKSQQTPRKSPTPPSTTSVTSTN
eukprot:TRINITY_DN20517_c0_g1_i1.p1 TRINITY_DN20517_c0_g1~~TRINITY_DN20517_c0_g1_i1.p1  ORF type:complete len:480 (-),score=160.75 TRINITY_DN20517_c0_g1_i1:202-1512(-)